MVLFINIARKPLCNKIIKIKYRKGVKRRKEGRKKETNLSKILKSKPRTKGLKATPHTSVTSPDVAAEATVLHRGALSTVLF